jgi:glycosyltransferase involved in cell wall biosynthesis
MISVIIPVFNQNEAFLRDAIQSIWMQTYVGRIEVILVDDGSDIPIENYIINKKIKFIRHEKNMGISAALNSGLQHATGKYICWLSSDDSFYPEKLEKQMLYIKKTGHKLVATGYNMVFMDGNVFGKNGLDYIAPHISENINSLKQEIRKECKINGSTLMFDREVFEKCGNFSQEYIYCQDWEYWLRVIVKYNYYIGKINEPLGYRREHKTNLSNGLYLDQDKLKIKTNELNLLRKIYGIH